MIHSLNTTNTTMANPPRAPSQNITRKPLSPSPFNPPDLPPLSAHLASEATMPLPAKALPPTPPPKDMPSEAAAPPQSAQQGRPGTPDFFLQNSTYSMPGAYPTTPGAYPNTHTHSSSPLAADPRTQTAETETPYSPQPMTPSPDKRRSSGNSIRTLLSSLRRPSSQSPRNPRASGDSYGGSSSIRSDTPGRDSMASSTRPSLRKKMSGTFWSKRKSSLGMEIMTDPENRDATGPSTPITVNRENGPDLTPEQSISSALPDEASESESIINSTRQRKSGTFWPKRKSSMGNELKSETVVAEPQKEYRSHAKITSIASGPSSADESPEPLRKKKSGTFWPRKLSLSLQRETEAAQQREGNGNGTLGSSLHETEDVAVEEPEEMSEEETYVPVQRPRSPPPKLPELNLEAGEGQGSFMNGGVDDLLGSIGRD